MGSMGHDKTDLLAVLRAKGEFSGSKEVLSAVVNSTRSKNINRINGLQITVHQLHIQSGRQDFLIRRYD